MKNRALIVIDIQNDYFSDGKWPLYKMERSAEQAARVLQHARNAGDMIVHVQHIADDEQPAFFAPDTFGAAIHNSVTPLEGEHLVVKHQVNSFVQTDLKALLDEQGIEAVTVIGSMSHMCIDAGVRAASDYGYRVTVVEDACATRDLEFAGKIVSAEDVHSAYMSALGFAYAEITDTEAYLSVGG